MAAAPPEPRELELHPNYDHFDFPASSIEARTGHPGWLTPDQQAQVHQLRMMLEAENFKGPLDSLTLLRFLRARKFDVAAAKKMLVESEQWRNCMTIVERVDKKTYGMQRLLSLDNDDPFKNPPEQPINLNETVRTWDRDGSFKKILSKYYTQFYHKTDKDGRPCYYEKLGGVNFDALKREKYTNDKMILNLAVEYEKMVDPRLPACSRQTGRLVETSCTILDVAGLSTWGSNKIYDYVAQTSSMSGANYPERMGKMFIINVSSLHKTAWWVIKGFLDPVTASKITLCTSSEYKEKLLEQIPAENLPASFGGLCQCEGGCELSDAGPWHDEKWTRPAWWQKDPTDTTIENKPSDIETSNGTAPGGETTVVDDAKASEVETGSGAATQGGASGADETKVTV
ncbi:CRAL-TRIO domain-containing protein [Xylaria arbuscula]|nr:CRAL-TRIO domain-containing protein [Xylaria arbuscula]